MHPLVREGLVFLRQLTVRAGRAGGTAIAESAAEDLELALRKGAKRIKEIRARWREMVEEERPRSGDGRDD